MSVEDQVRKGRPSTLGMDKKVKKDNGLPTENSRRTIDQLVGVVRMSWN